MEGGNREVVDNGNETAMKECPLQVPKCDSLHACLHTAGLHNNTNNDASKNVLIQ